MFLPTTATRCIPLIRGLSADWAVILPSDGRLRHPMANQGFSDRDSRARSFGARAARPTTP